MGDTPGRKVDAGIENEEPNDESHTTTRRRLIEAGVTTTGALVVGVGSFGAASAEPGRVGAPGKGGEAIVADEDYREYQDRRFRILEFDGRREEFQCEGQGQTISFPAWKFEYENSDQKRLLYTRDNNVATGALYEWRPLDSGAKDCGDFVQSSFRAVEDS